MGIFEKFGREVERFKQAAVETAEAEATYRCADCGKLYYTEHERCPECGGAVVAIESDAQDGEAADGTDAAERDEPAEAAEQGDSSEAAQSAGTADAGEPADSPETAEE